MTTEDLQALIAEALVRSACPDDAAAVMAVLRDPGNRERVLTEIGMERVRGTSMEKIRGLHATSPSCPQWGCVPVYAPLPVTEGNET